jgi:hypothetical protein
MRQRATMHHGNQVEDLFTSALFSLMYIVPFLRLLSPLFVCFRSRKADVLQAEE